MNRNIWMGLVALAIVFHALFPRYEWRDPGGDDQTIFVRIDRWTGRAEFGQFFNESAGHMNGVWKPTADIRGGR